MDVPLDRLMVFDPSTKTLYSASELTMMMNGNMLQLNLPSSTQDPKSEPVKKKRRISKYQRTFGRNLKRLDSEARNKNGSYRSGMTKAKILSKAHKLTRKELGMR